MMLRAISLVPPPMARRSAGTGTGRRSGTARILVDHRLPTRASVVSISNWMVSAWEILMIARPPRAASRRARRGRRGRRVVPARRGAPARGRPSPWRGRRRPAPSLQDCGIVDVLVGFALGADAAGEFGATADGPALVVHLLRCHGPAVVHLADDGVVAEFEVVEELLAEFVAASTCRMRRMVIPVLDRHQEHGEALVLGHVSRGPGEQEAVVGGEGAGAPGLGAVDDPPVPAALCAGDDAGQIGSAAGLGEQLHQHLVAADGTRDVLTLCSSDPVSRIVAHRW